MASAPFWYYYMPAPNAFTGFNAFPPATQSSSYTGGASASAAPTSSVPFIRPADESLAGARPAKKAKVDDHSGYRPSSPQRPPRQSAYASGSRTYPQRRVPTRSPSPDDPRFWTRSRSSSPPYYDSSYYTRHDSPPRYRSPPYYDSHSSPCYTRHRSPSIYGRDDIGEYATPTHSDDEDRDRTSHTDRRAVSPPPKKRKRQNNNRKRNARKREAKQARAAAAAATSAASGSSFGGPAFVDLAVSQVGLAPSPLSSPTINAAPTPAVATPTATPAPGPAVPPIARIPPKRNGVAPASYPHDGNVKGFGVIAPALPVGVTPPVNPTAFGFGSAIQNTASPLASTAPFASAVVVPSTTRPPPKQDVIIPGSSLQDGYAQGPTTIAPVLSRPTATATGSGYFGLAIQDSATTAKPPSTAPAAAAAPTKPPSPPLLPKQSLSSDHGILVSAPAPAFYEQHAAGVANGTTLNRPNGNTNAPVTTAMNAPAPAQSPSAASSPPAKSVINEEPIPPTAALKQNVDAGEKNTPPVSAFASPPPKSNPPSISGTSTLSPRNNLPINTAVFGSPSWNNTTPAVRTPNSETSQQSGTSGPAAATASSFSFYSTGTTPFSTPIYTACAASTAPIPSPERQPPPANSTATAVSASPEIKLEHDDSGVPEAVILKGEDATTSTGVVESTAAPDPAVASSSVPLSHNVTPPASIAPTSLSSDVHVTIKQEESIHTSTTPRAIAGDTAASAPPRRDAIFDAPASSGIRTIPKQKSNIPLSASPSLSQDSSATTTPSRNPMSSAFTPSSSSDIRAIPKQKATIPASSLPGAIPGDATAGSSSSQDPSVFSAPSENGLSPAFATPASLDRREVPKQKATIPVTPISRPIASSSLPSSHAVSAADEASAGSLSSQDPAATAPPTYIPSSTKKNEANGNADADTLPSASNPTSGTIVNQHPPPPSIIQPQDDKNADNNGTNVIPPTLTTSPTHHIPLALLHRVFGEFIDDMHNLTPNVREFKVLKDVSEALAPPTPTTRSTGALVDLFVSLVKDQFGITFANKSSADAKLISLRAEVNNRPFIMIESLRGSFPFHDPFLLSRKAYERYVATLSSDTSLLPALPCLHIIFSGPFISFAGSAMASGSHRFEIITSAIPLACHTDFDDGLKTLAARSLGAMANAADRLKVYYASVTSSPAIRSPYCTVYRRLERNFLATLTLEKLVRPDKLLYYGQEDHSVPVMVQFVRKFSRELHEQCCSYGRALALRAIEKLPGGWLMVVTDCPDSDLVASSGPLPVSVQAALEEFVKRLNGRGFVFDDDALRADNVRYDPRENGRFVLLEMGMGRRSSRFPMSTNRGLS